MACVVYSCTLIVGLSAQSDPDVVGQSHHGHAGVTGSGHRTTDRRTAGTEAVRTYQAAYLSYDDQEHRCTCCLSAGRHSGTALRWSVAVRDRSRILEWSSGDIISNGRHLPDTF